MGKDKSPEDLVKEKSFEYYKVENELQRKFVKQLEYNGFRKKEYYSNDDAAKRLHKPLFNNVTIFGKEV